MEEFVRKDRILFVDDEKSNLLLVKHIFNDKYDISMCTDPFKFLSTLESYEPDLILLDIMMPEIDGLTLCKDLKCDEKYNLYKDIPVIMVTSVIDDKTLKEALELGAVDYITKPFSDIDLEARVNSAIRTKKYVDKIKSLNRLKDGFLSMVSHDIKTPLTSVIGYCELLLDENLVGSLNDKQRSMITKILGAGYHQLKIIKDLLNISIFETGRLELKKTFFNFHEVYKVIYNEIFFKIKEKKIDMELDVPHNLKIYADRDRFIQVLSNLLVNAIKFSYSSSSIKIVLEDRGDDILFSIIDHGEGIDRTDIEKIMNPYSIYTTVSHDGEKGTGLGIMIVRKIVYAHSGQFWIESEKGKGSVFNFTLPKKLDD